MFDTTSIGKCTANAGWPAVPDQFRPARAAARFDPKKTTFGNRSKKSRTSGARGGVNLKTLARDKELRRRTTTTLPPLTPNHPTPSRYYGYQLPGYTGHVQSGQFRFGKTYSVISRDVMAISPNGLNAASLFDER